MKESVSGVHCAGHGDSAELLVSGRGMDKGLNEVGGDPFKGSYRGDSGDIDESLEARIEIERRGKSRVSILKVSGGSATSGGEGWRRGICKEVVSRDGSWGDRQEEFWVGRVEDRMYVLPRWNRGNQPSGK